MLDSEIDVIRNMGAVFMMNTPVTPVFFEDEIIPAYDAVIVTTGNRNLQAVEDFGISAESISQTTHKRSFVTNRPGIFACGNVVREHEMAVRAAAQGRMAAAEVGIYLKTHSPEKSIHFNSTFGHLSEPEQKEYLKESISLTRIEPEGGFVSGFNREQAIAEASRCLHCDCRKPVSCKLRIYADQYGANRKRHLGPDRKPVVKEFHHELIIYEPEKCIRCGLCVEISSKIEPLGLSYIGRGFDVRISVPFSENLAEALKKAAAECVNACPTGAMAFKKQEERL